MHCIPKQQATTDDGRSFLRSELGVRNGKLKEEKKKEQERGVDRWLLHKILLYHLIIFSLLDKICFTYVMQMTLCQT